MFNRVEIVLCDCCDSFVVVFKSLLHLFLLLRGVLEMTFHVKFVYTKGEERVAIVAAPWIGRRLLVALAESSNLLLSTWPKVVATRAARLLSTNYMAAAAARFPGCRGHHSWLGFPSHPSAPSGQNSWTHGASKQPVFLAAQGCPAAWVSRLQGTLLGL